MKKPLFDSSERRRIYNYYNNPILYPKSILIDDYELSKAVSRFKKLIRKPIFKFLDTIFKSNK